MALTITTIENLTTIAVTGANAATNVFVPSPAEIGRYRIRVVRVVAIGATVGDTISITGITPKPSDGSAETQTLWNTVATAANFIDQTSFPDEHEWRGRIQIASTGTLGGTCTVFLYHG
jgi:hypothetical protein